MRHQRCSSADRVGDLRITIRDGNIVSWTTLAESAYSTRRPLFCHVRRAHAEPVRADPFGLGIASGDPLPDRVVLWTRLVRGDGIGSAPYGDRRVEVGWQVATDERFRHVVRSGTAS